MPTPPVADTATATPCFDTAAPAVPFFDASAAKPGQQRFGRRCWTVSLWVTAGSGVAAADAQGVGIPETGFGGVVVKRLVGEIVVRPGNTVFTHGGGCALFV
jgi:hypothetical protein